MTGPDAADAIRRFAADRQYRPATVGRWLALPTASGAALLTLATELRLGENQLRDLWTWAEDIAARDGIGLDTVLDEPAIAAARRRPVGRSDRLRLIKHALRRRRFPLLAETEDRLQAAVRALGLPAHVRLTLPEFLEGDTVHVDITAGDVAALRAAAHALLAAADRPECAALFAMLHEAP